ncbi:MAG: MqnA/MqnD/SBP family protein, partial [Fibrobacteria bacterium]
MKKTMRIRSAISPCPNDVFIFAGLICGGVSAPGLEFEFAYHELETLNRDANDGLWDLAKISYANHVACAKDYRLLRCGGALGRGCGPLLLSNRESADGGGTWNPREEVLVPGSRTTANFLLDFYVSSSASAVPGRILSAMSGAGSAGGAAGAADATKAASPQRIRPLEKTFMPFDALYRRLLGKDPCQGVVIHEMRFTYAADGLHLIRDLGAFWEERTGFPIPLGAVALRNRLEVERPGLAAQVEIAIRASLEWSYAHPEAALDLCRAQAQTLSDPVLKAH